MEYAVILWEGFRREKKKRRGEDYEGRGRAGVENGVWGCGRIG